MHYGKPGLTLLLMLALACSSMLSGGRAWAQQPASCVPSRDVTADIGSPGQDGLTLQSQFGQISELRNWVFHLPAARSVYVYVGDQWYDLDLGVYSVAEDKLIACWRVTKDEAVSARSQRRVIQLIRPDDRILELLPAGDYALIVRPAYWYEPGLATDFDPSRAFTVRLATAPIACAVNPPNDEVDPQYPLLKRRRSDDQNLYQLGLSYQPMPPGPFDLMTFNAIISPPFTDLFDFEWRIDGQPVPDGNQPTVQAAVIGLAKLPAGAAHSVSVVARGAREYPDPDQPHIPPTLTAECSFVVKA